MGKVPCPGAQRCSGRWRFRMLPPAPLRLTALYNPDKKCSHIHTSSLTRWCQRPSLARWPCLVITMSKCGGHWEWSLPGSLSFSVVLLRPTPSQRDGSAILRGHASHERYTVSNVEGARNKSPQVYPARTGDWTRDCRVTGAHATTCAIATLRSTYKGLILFDLKRF